MKEGSNFKGFGLVILICLLFFFPTSVWAAVYYVDFVNGNDTTGDGTSPATAWKTLHRAIGEISDGDTLNVAAGTYACDGAPDGEPDAELTITQSNVTIQGAPGGTSIIDGSIAVTWTTGIIIDASNVTIRGLAVRYFSGFSEAGILVSTGTENVIEGCEIYNNNHGIEVEDSSPTIRKNRIYDNNNGIFVLGDDGTASPSISNNLIYDTSDAMSDGIHLETGSTSGTASPTIYHNTIDGGTSDGVFVSAFDGSASPEIKYNIITNFGNYGIANDSAYPGSPVMDYNDVWSNGAGPADNYSGCAAGTNDITQDPRYASYELLSNSPCIDAIPLGAGDTVNEDLEGNPRPQGDGRDMGCYEDPVSVPQSVPIPPGTEVEDYKMVSFTVRPDDPACISVFGDEMGGSYDLDNFRIGAYDPTIDGYVDCGSGLEIVPGRAFWILARNGLDFTVNGTPASVSDTEVELLYNATSGNGWNQIACPNDANYSWDDVEVLEGDNVIGAISDPSSDGLIDKRLWRWEDGLYHDDTTLMEQGEGYWVQVKKANVSLRFRQSVQLAQLSNAGIMFASVLNKTKRWMKKWVFAPQAAIADSGDSPPLPMEDFSGRTSTSEAGSSRGGGCFIATVAMD